MTPFILSLVISFFCASIQKIKDVLVKMYDNILRQHSISYAKIFVPVPWFISCYWLWFKKEVLSGIIKYNSSHNHLGFCLNWLFIHFTNMILVIWMNLYIWSHLTDESDLKKYIWNFQRNVVQNVCHIIPMVIILIFIT